MKRIITTFIISFLLTGIVTAQTTHDTTYTTISQSLRTALKSKLSHFIAAERKAFNAPALSFAILYPYNKTPQAITSGTILLNGKKPITSNTLFQVGSITKTFTAALLVDELTRSEIALTTKVDKYLTTYPRWNNIKVKQLVNQTSGIHDYIDTKDWWMRLEKSMQKNVQWQPATLVELAYQYKDNFRPGSHWQYSNTNYVLLGMMLSQAANRSVGFLMNVLLQNTGLWNTHYLPKPYPQKVMQQMAHGYYEKDDMTTLNGSWLQAAGAMVSTPSDMVHWYRQLVPLERIGEPVQIQLAKYFRMVDTLTGKPTTSLKQTSYGFGLFRMNTPQGLIWFTPGLTPGYTSVVAYMPCLGVYIAYSASRAPLHGFNEKMLMGVMQLLKQDKAYQTYLSKIALPAFCKTLKPAVQFKFPEIN